MNAARTQTVTFANSQSNLQLDNRAHKALKLVDKDRIFKDLGAPF